MRKAIFAVLMIAGFAAVAYGTALASLAMCGHGSAAALTVGYGLMAAGIAACVAAVEISI